MAAIATLVAAIVAMLTLLGGFGKWLGSFFVGKDRASHTKSFTVIQGISVDEYQRLAEKLGVTEAALKSFFTILGQKQVALEDRDSKLREIKVFLCHSSHDKESIRQLYHRLKADGLDPWLDEEKLEPGQEWESEIAKWSFTKVCMSLRFDI